MILIKYLKKKKMV